MTSGINTGQVSAGKPRGISPIRGAPVNQIIPAALPANKATNWPGAYLASRVGQKTPTATVIPAIARASKSTVALVQALTLPATPPGASGQTEGWENLGADQDYAGGDEEPRQQRVGDVDDEPPQSGQPKDHQKTPDRSAAVKPAASPCSDTTDARTIATKNVRA